MRRLLIRLLPCAIVAACSRAPASFDEGPAASSSARCMAFQVPDQFREYHKRLGYEYLYPPAPPGPEDAWKDRLGPPMTEVPERYPGPCVKPGPPPLEYARMGAPTEDLNPTVVVGPDFDGDKTEDLLVSAPAYCKLPQDCFHALYVVRGSCGHFAGVVHGLEFGIKALASKSEGLHDLDVATYEAKGDGDLISFGSTRTHVRYQFNGRAYVPTKQQKCKGQKNVVSSEEVCEPWVKWRGDAGAPKKRTTGTK